MTARHKIEFDYHISAEWLRRYRDLPDIDKLRWLDEIVRFTLLWRSAQTQIVIKAREPR